jgi:hypothetical protein
MKTTSEDVIHEGGILPDSAYLEELHRTSTESPENHHIRTLPPHHDNFYSTENSIREPNFNHDEQASESTKMHIFHTESSSYEISDPQPSTHNMHDNNFQHKHQTSSENSHGDVEQEKNSHSEQKHDELTESSLHSSVGYVDENKVDRNEDEMNSDNDSDSSLAKRPPDHLSNSENSQNISSDENEPHSDKENHVAQNEYYIREHESEISSTQSHIDSQLNAVDNETSNEDASDTDIDPGHLTGNDAHSTTEFSDAHRNNSATYSPTENQQQTTRFTKKRKIKKSRPVTTTVSMTTVAR